MKNKGFTLFELLITISIIGILTAIATISFSSAQKKGRDARRMQDMKNIQTAAEQYYSQQTTPGYPATGTFSGFVNTLIGSSLIPSTPTDPKGGTYVYTLFSDPTVSYCVCAQLENITAGNSTNNNPCAFATSGRYFCVRNQQ